MFGHPVPCNMDTVLQKQTNVRIVHGSTKAYTLVTGFGFARNTGIWLNRLCWLHIETMADSLQVLFMPLPYLVRGLTNKFPDLNPRAWGWSTSNCTEKPRGNRCCCCCWWPEYSNICSCYPTTKFTWIILPPIGFTTPVVRATRGSRDFSSLGSIKEEVRGKKW